MKKPKLKARKRVRRVIRRHPSKPAAYSPDSEIPRPMNVHPDILRMAFGQMLASIIPLDFIKRAMEKKKDEADEKPENIQ